MGVHALHGTELQQGPRRGRLVAAAVPAAIALAWAPSFVAEAYDGDGVAGTEGQSYLTRPDRGWVFLADSVRLSRGARLGTETAAMDTARELWGSGRPVATSVRLLYGAEPFDVSVPEGGVAPTPGKSRVQPRSELTWLVTGSVDGGPSQPLGMLDYHDGRVVWDIRPLRRAPG